MDHFTPGYADYAYLPWILPYFANYCISSGITMACDWSKSRFLPPWMSKIPWSYALLSRLLSPRARCTLQLRVGASKQWEINYPSTAPRQPTWWIKVTIHSGRSFHAHGPPDNLSKIHHIEIAPSWTRLPPHTARPTQSQMLAPRLHSISSWAF